MYRSKIEKYIKQFQRDKCNGKKINGKHFVIEDGKCDIMISAPHAVNHYREGIVKYADINTGVIAKVLHEQCGCPIIYTCGYEEADANWDEPDKCLYKQALKEYIEEKGIKLLIDIHGSKETSKLAVEFGTVDDNDRSLQGYAFVVDLLRICFEKYILDLKGKIIDKNKIFSARKSSTVTNYISTVCKIPCIQIEINKIFRTVESGSQTIRALISAINILQTVEWEDKKIRVFKAEKSNTLFPLYKAEISDVSKYMKGDVLMVCSDTKSFVEVECFKKDNAEDDVIYLTNRIIKILFKEDNDFQGRPVILYSTHTGSFPVGTPAAERLEVSASAELFDCIFSDRTHDFVLYNRYSDTKMYFTPQKYFGVKGQKIMLSYYYRKLMGIELPLREIKKDYMELILNKLDEEDKIFFAENYELMKDDGIYKLSNKRTMETKMRMKGLEERLELNKLELLRYPKEKQQTNRLRAMADKMVESILEIYIGSKTIEFRTCRTIYPIDDQLMIVRMSKDMMNLLGVSENDYVWVKYGDKKVSLKVFEGNISSEMIHIQDDNETDMIISVPALARQKLKMLNINNVVSVRRDTRYCLRRHISRQIFAILGTFLTIFTLSDTTIFRVICGIIAIPIILYFDFSEERVLTKYKERECN